MYSMYIVFFCVYKSKTIRKILKNGGYKIWKLYKDFKHILHLFLKQNGYWTGYFVLAVSWKSFWCLKFYNKLSTSPIIYFEIEIYTNFIFMLLKNFLLNSIFFYDRQKLYDMKLYVHLILVICETMTNLKLNAFIDRFMYT